MAAAEEDNGSFELLEYAIKEEILRFESVHPCIYAMYDLIETINNREIRDTIHNNLVTIEDAFVNSQEWTLNRYVGELKLGLLGSADSGKSALVHRFLTGSFLQDASPEGGRFKCCIRLSGAPHLALIRDEAEPPSRQFAVWCDACLLVFAAGRPDSLAAAADLRRRLAEMRRLPSLPLIVVGVLDSASEARTQADAASRQAAAAAELDVRPEDMVYFEACTATGYNVERVFTEACRAALAARRNRGLEPEADAAAGDATPVAVALRRREAQKPQPPARFPQPELDFAQRSSEVFHSRNGSAISVKQQQQQQKPVALRNLTATRPQPAPLATEPLEFEVRARNSVNLSQDPLQQHRPPAPSAVPPQIPLRDRRSSQLHPDAAAPQPPQPQPQQPPPQQRRSHLFGSPPEAAPAVSVGSGRAIPVKQGVLAKRCTGGLSSEWRRKFVTLGEDGRLTYYASLHEYMENGRGRCVDLGQATVRLQDQPHHHKRGKSGGGGGEAAGFELVTLDGRVRQFEAPSRDVRDAWVTALRAATLGRLRAGRDGDVDGDDAAALLEASRRLPGNERCADCGAPQPDWASVSLGLLICLRCSGAHRQLGTHLSRVRSLHLDSWTAGHALPLSVVGNALGNSVWEARLPQGARPSPGADSAEWEAFARAKYERGDFLPDAARPSDLADAAASCSTRRLLAALARACPVDLDALPADSARLPPLHACAAAGSRAHLQLLLWRGASPAVRDRRGRTAADCARAAGHADCEKLLQLASSS